MNMLKEPQYTNHLLLIRPMHFHYNPQTAVNNYFQRGPDISEEKVQLQAKKEFEDFVELLRSRNIDVIVIDDTRSADTPDSLFPNNWISFHADGRVGWYPMFARNRRQERRKDILDTLQNEHHFIVRKVVDFSAHENNGKFLEATGSLVLDRENCIVYAALSERTDPDLVMEFCQKFGYRPIIFQAFQTVNNRRVPIYHTNVMMCVAEQYAVICLESIDRKEERILVKNTLEKSGKEIIPISEQQNNQFGGNMLQVAGMDGEKYLVMSSRAYEALTSNQLQALEKYNAIIHSPLTTIENVGGGSARCMIAEIFLPKGSL